MAYRGGPKNDDSGDVMDRTQRDPVDDARTIVRDCLLRERAARKPLPQGDRTAIPRKSRLVVDAPAEPVDPVDPVAPTIVAAIVAAMLVALVAIGWLLWMWSRA
jgi:hypothetical protein